MGGRAGGNCRSGARAILDEQLSAVGHDDAATDGEA